MSTENNKYDGPTLCVSVASAGGDGKYRWEVTMGAPDSKGQRKLGYRAAGFLDSLGTLPSGFPIEVHDESRDVWTAMNLADRKDIRVRMESLVAHAVMAMVESGY